MRAITHLTEVLTTALEGMGLTLPERASIEQPRDKSHGDLATNAAMLLAKEAKMAPRQLAEKIREAILAMEASHIESIEVAGPGFLNFVFTSDFWQGVVPLIGEQGADYGRSSLGQGVRFQVEFVSANPTGPLHIGHGRGAAIGDSLARILTFTGYDVSTEYYINDAGRQMNLLGASILARYRERFGREGDFPEDGYKGDYIADLAADLAKERGDTLLAMGEAEAVGICREYGSSKILASIKKDLEDFGVTHEVWFSEKSLIDDGGVEKALKALAEKGLAYESDGALWFKATEFGDEKDRVLKKSSGDLTYFASDIAYHANKYDRGFDKVVDIWGADHHGYIPRMRAAVAALGKEPDQFDVILVQLVNLLRGGEQIAMSTRAGKFETLRDVVDEVGSDSSRFIFLSRKSDSKLDFDLDLVKEQSMENPVYYVQYAHARIKSVFKKAEETGFAMPETVDLALLGTPEDIELLKCLERFPEAVDAAARTLSPHHVSYYLRELAGLLHRYYTVNQILGTNTSEVAGARLTLISKVARVLANGLNLLGVTAPDRM